MTTVTLKNQLGVLGIGQVRAYDAAPETPRS